jgi:hypothetical protein
MTKHSFKSKKFVQAAVPPGSQPSNNKLSVIDPKKSKPRKYDSCVINNDGVFIHVAHLVAHSSSGTDSVFESIAEETHKYSREKRIITACPLSAKWFHVFKVIERKPGGRKLEYKNVLANSVASRFITGTKENATATRTKDGYKIECDIDQHVADNWSKKIGKPCLTPMEMVQRHVEADPHPRMRYPADLVGDTIVKSEDETEDEEDDDEEETVGNKRNRAEDEYSTNKKNKIQ